MIRRTWSPAAWRRPGIALVALLCSACAGQESYREHRVPGGDAERGARFIRTYGCTACHVVPGVTTTEPSYIGPPLGDWARRQYIAGSLVNNAENLIRWLVDPDEVEPNTAMPDLGVSATEARDMAAYLFTLGEGSTPRPTDLTPGEETR